MPFDVIPLDTPIAGPMLIAPKILGDARGFFMESYNQRDFEALGIDVVFVQDNQSRSARGILRGLHFQMTRPQAKLVRVLSGRVFDVAVDLRAGSPTEGRWCGVKLDGEQMRMFYVPEGFAHGFLALSERVDLAYKCSDFYCPGDEGGLVWDDPELDIDWPLDHVGHPQLSEKDAALPRLGQMNFRFERSRR